MPHGVFISRLGGLSFHSEVKKRERREKTKDETADFHEVFICNIVSFCLFFSKSHLIDSLNVIFLCFYGVYLQSSPFPFGLECSLVFSESFSL